MKFLAPPVPPRNFENSPSVGTKLEGLLLNEFEQDDDFDPRSFEQSQNTNVNGNFSSPPLCKCNLFLISYNLNCCFVNKRVSCFLVAPPPKAARRTNLNNNDPNPTKIPQDIFGSSPFAISPTPPTSNSISNTKTVDPFEMGDFGSAATSQEIENAIGLLDKRILEMKTGFSRGLSFGNDDFSLESLDPLKN